MAMEKFAIALHRDSLCYATICGGGYQPYIRRFEQGDYVYLQHITLTILDVIVGCVILCVWKVLPFGVLLLEGRDGQTWKDHVHNCAPCQIPNVNGQMDPFLVMVPIGL
jgi:hypothetical protein